MQKTFRFAKSLADLDLRFKISEKKSFRLTRSCDRLTDGHPCQLVVFGGYFIGHPRTNTTANFS